MTGDRELLEQRLGYHFHRPELIERALTHSSAIPELRAAVAANVPSGDPSGPDSIQDTIQDNEQLEFLGDAVLDMVASEYLLSAFPDWSEGQLSKSRARLVNARSLEIGARRLKLGEHLRLGRGEEKTGGRNKPAILADALEAIVAAVYLDGGLEAARGFLLRVLFEKALEERGERIADTDRKSALQEFLQARGHAPAEYRLAGASGPDHRKMFVIEVWVNGERMASAEGASKKEAEQRAAHTALVRLEEMSPKDQAG
jgi:ribonuclease III